MKLVMSLRGPSLRHEKVRQGLIKIAHLQYANYRLRNYIASGTRPFKNYTNF